MLLKLHKESILNPDVSGFPAITCVPLSFGNLRLFGIWCLVFGIFNRKGGDVF